MCTTPQDSVCHCMIDDDDDDDDSVTCMLSQMKFDFLENSN